MSHGGKRAGAGRPRSSAPKLHHVGIRVDAETLAALEQLAKSRGLTLTRLVRNAILAYAAFGATAVPARKPA